MAKVEMFQRACWRQAKLVGVETVDEREEPLPRKAIEEWDRVVFGDVGNRLVLLGAGASVEAGLPDGRSLASSLAETAEVPILMEILGKLGTDSIPDIERAISVLEVLADLKNADSFARDLELADILRAPLPAGPARAQAELDYIKYHLRRRLWLVDGLGVGFVSRILGQPYEPPEQVRYLCPLVEGSVGGTIATLNYDNTLEQAGGPLVQVCDPSAKRVRILDEQPSVCRVLKLHGSLNWRQIDDDVISGARPLESEEYEPGVIFGAVNKLRPYGPFLDLLRAFTVKLMAVRILYVVGYGFRDRHINETLRVWANTPGDDSNPKRLIVCQGPNARRLPDLVEKWSVQQHLMVDFLPKPTSELVDMAFNRQTHE